MIVPGPIFRGSRTSRSSPANHVSSPFPPPSFAATADLDEPLPRQFRTAHGFSEPPSQVPWEQDSDYLSSSQPAGPLPQWDNFPRYSTFGQGPNRPSRPVSGVPYPTVAARPGPSPLMVPGAVQGQQVPTGYTSQPMSRDPSHQSSASGLGQSSGGGSNHSPSPLSLSVQSVDGYSSSVPMVPRMSKPRPIGNPVKVVSGSSPLGISNSSNPSIPGHNVNLGGKPSMSPMQLQMPLVPININAPGSGAGRLPPIKQAQEQQQYLHQPASYTETEPSPRMESVFQDADTSYSRWEQNQGRHQSASVSYQSPTAGGHASASTRPSMAATTKTSSSSPHPQPTSAIHWRNLGRGVGLTRRRTKERIQNVLGGRSQQSESVSPSAFQNAAQEQRRSSSPSIGTGGIVGAGAGILLDDGTIFQFPSSPNIDTESLVGSGMAWEGQQTGPRPMAMPLQGAAKPFQGPGTPVQGSLMSPVPSTTHIPTPPTPPSHTATGLGIAGKTRTRTRARSGSSPGPWRPSSAMSSMSIGNLHRPRPWGHGEGANAGSGGGT